MKFFAIKCFILLSAIAPSSIAMASNWVKIYKKTNTGITLFIDKSSIKKPIIFGNTTAWVKYIIPKSSYVRRDLYADEVLYYLEINCKKSEKRVLFSKTILYRELTKTSSTKNSQFDPIIPDSFDKAIENYVC
jgi:hypothetical protein